MEIKNIMRAAALLFLSVFITGTIAVSAQSTVLVRKNFENLIFHDSRDRAVKIRGIELPYFQSKEPKFQCWHKNVHTVLKDKIKEGIHLKNFQKTEHNIYLADAYFQQKNGAIDLLEKGLARTKDTDNVSYHEAQKRAKDNHVGIWSWCGEYSHWQSQTTQKKIQTKFPTLIGKSTTAQVQKILTGNTLLLSNGATVNLLGVIVPPETHERPDMACIGKYSRKFLEFLIQNNNVFLHYDSHFPDTHLKIQRWVSIFPRIPVDTTTGKKTERKKIFLNHAMVRYGFARTNIQEIRSTEQRKLFLSDEIIAQQKLYGAWGKCLSKIIPTIQEKEDISVTPQHPSQDTCTIKGNISGTKKNPRKTYHTLRSPWYTRTKAEQCFQTETDAIKAGFTKVK